MRFTNLAFLVGLAIGAIPAYLLLDQLGQSLGMPSLAGTADSLASIMWETIVPRILMVYAVLFLCGVILFRYLNSEVPLKWCLALGAIYGAGYLILTLAFQASSAGGIFLPGLFCLGLLLSPILGGIQAKRLATRKRA
jgi:hypothetical protein